MSAEGPAATTLSWPLAVKWGSPQDGTRERNRLPRCGASPREVRAVSKLTVAMLTWVAPADDLNTSSLKTSSAAVSSAGMQNATPACNASCALSATRAPTAASFSADARDRFHT